jgi:hypothetical protein
MCKFRDLRADEIECRVAQAKENGVSLLLYKDARCDMNILDETVGATNWMRQHCRDNANCIVSIWDEKKQMWIEKEDTGTESNTEKEKGLASDSFKRACFNWGIGRELYTAPFIWIKAADCSALKKNDYGKWQCGDRFEVNEIVIENKRIVGLTIKNAKTGKIAFTMGKQSEEKPIVMQTEEKPAPKRTAVVCADCGKSVTPIVKNGVVMKSAEEVANWSQNTFNGETFCWFCAKKRLDRQAADANA